MPTGAGPFGALADASGPVPFTERSGGVPVRSVRGLMRVLRHLAARRPRLVAFRKPNAPLLLIGVAGELAAVEAFPSPASVRSWTARAKGSYSAVDLEVPFEGTPSWFAAAAAMPVEEVLAIVAHVAETGGLPTAYSWVNARGEALELPPSSGARAEPKG